MKPMKPKVTHTFPLQVGPLTNLRPINIVVEQIETALVMTSRADAFMTVDFDGNEASTREKYAGAIFIGQNFDAFVAIERRNELVYRGTYVDPDFSAREVTSGLESAMHWFLGTAIKETLEEISKNAASSVLISCEHSLRSFRVLSDDTERSSNIQTIARGIGAFLERINVGTITTRIDEIVVTMGAEVYAVWEGKPHLFEDYFLPANMQARIASKRSELESRIAELERTMESLRAELTEAGRELELFDKFERL